jgi:hypothetical protein
VRSARVVELLMSVSTVQNIVGAALKTTTPFLFSVEPYVVKSIELYYFAFSPSYKIFPTAVNNKNLVEITNTMH